MVTVELAGKVALVTGGSRGIGRAIALRLAHAGAHVIITFFRNRTAAKETAEAISASRVRAHVVKVHVGDPDQVRALFEEVEHEFGALDVLVSNAASGVARPVLDLEVKEWDWTINTNARALLLLAQGAAPLMVRRGGGHVVAVSSLGARQVEQYYAAVGAAKAALESLTRYLAVELAPYGIVVNAVAAGVVATDALQHFPNRTAMLEKARTRTPAGRMVTPEDVAAVVHFLCTPAADMIRGQTIVVDGGISLLI